MTALLQSSKDRIKTLVAEEKPFTPEERPSRIKLAVNDENGSRQGSRLVTFSGLYGDKAVVYPEDCAELAYYFKRLGKKLSG